MKVAQLLATIPDALPPEYANELIKLQSQAPPMGWAFVKRRMQAELGAGWEKKFETFEHHPAAAASLGQVHKARALDGAELACKLQYPDMQSAVEADLNQLQLLLALRKRFDPAIDTSEIAVEIAARLREELDYIREAKHVALYAAMLKGQDAIRIPNVWPELSTGRLLTLDWMEGSKMLAHTKDPLASRNRLATAMFTAWWLPFSRFGVIHGDPHLGNYSVFEERAGHQSARLWLRPHFPAELCRRRGRPLSRAAQGRRRPGGARLRDLGLQAAVARIDRRAQHLGALHLRPAARRPRAHHRRRREALRIRPQGSLPRAPGAQSQGPGHRAARVRVHGPRRHRARRRVPAPGGGAEFLSIVQRGDRELRHRQSRRAAKRRARGRRAGARLGPSNPLAVALAGQLR